MCNLCHPIMHTTEEEEEHCCKLNKGSYCASILTHSLTTHVPSEYRNYQESILLLRKVESASPTLYHVRRLWTTTGTALQVFEAIVLTASLFSMGQTTLSCFKRVLNDAWPYSLIYSQDLGGFRLMSANFDGRDKMITYDIKPSDPPGPRTLLATCTHDLPP